MKEGNKSDKMDARRLAELLRLNHLSPVYHGEHGLRNLKELVRSYLTAFLVRTSRSMHCAIVASGWRRSANRACSGGRSFTTNSWMP